MHQKYIMMWNNCTNQLSPIINHLPNTNTFSALSSFNQEKGAKSMQTLSSANCLLMNIFKKKKVIEFEYSPYTYTFVPPACIFTLHKIFHTNFICFSFLQIIPKRKREIKFMPVWKIFNINKYMSPWMLTFAVFEFLDGHNLICFLQQIKRRGCIRGLCPQSKHFVILTEMVKIKWLLLYGLRNF